MTPPAAPPREPKPGQLLFLVVVTLWVGVGGMVRAGQPWQWWFALVVTVTSAWTVVDWVLDWRRHRAWVRSNEPDRPPHW